MRTGSKSKFTMVLVCVLAAAVAVPLCAAAQQSPDRYPSPHSYLGVDIRDIDSDRAKALNLNDETGVEVTMVDQDAPAGKAGIHEHDVILTFNGHKVDSAEKLRRLVRETPSGRAVQLGLMRDGKPLTISVTLADRHEIMQQWSARRGSGGTNARPPAPPWGMGNGFIERGWMEMDLPSFTEIHSSSRTGITVENLTPQLAEYFGVKQGAGVLVRAVEKGSEAEKSGLHAGDVIIKVEKAAINDVGDWRRAIHGHSGALAFTVLRDRKEQTLTIQLPERKHREGGALQPGEKEMESYLGLDELQAQLDLMLPDVEPQSMEFAQRELEKHQGEIDRAMRELDQQMRRMEKQQIELEIVLPHPDTI